MPDLSQHQSLEFVKGLVLGNPGAGKTGGLESLVRAGYRVCVWDYDNLLGSLAQQIMHHCPERMSQVIYQTFTDKMKGSDIPLVMNGAQAKVLPFVDGTPTAFVKGLMQLNAWKVKLPDGTFESLGKPAEWGKDSVVVIDSLTNLAGAAFRYAQAMNPGAKDGQTYYFSAQQMVMNLIMLLFSEQFRTNVLVLAHIDYRENESEILKGFPRTIGSALKDQVSVYFNTVLLVEARGTGQSIKRQIRTNSNGIVDLKNPIPFKVDDVLPLETGFATFFKAVTNYQPQNGATNG